MLGACCIQAVLLPSAAYQAQNSYPNVQLNHSSVSVHREGIKVHLLLMACLREANSPCMLQTFAMHHSTSQPALPYGGTAIYQAQQVALPNSKGICRAGGQAIKPQAD